MLKIFRVELVPVRVIVPEPLFETVPFAVSVLSYAE